VAGLASAPTAKAAAQRLYVNLDGLPAWPVNFGTTSSGAGRWSLALDRRQDLGYRQANGVPAACLEVW